MFKREKEPILIESTVITDPYLNKFLEIFHNIEKLFLEDYLEHKILDKNTSKKFLNYLFSAIEMLIEYSKNNEKENTYYLMHLEKIKDKIRTNIKESKSIIIMPYTLKKIGISKIAQEILTDSLDRDVLKLKQLLLLSTISFFDFIENGEKIVYSHTEINDKSFFKQEKIIHNKFQKQGVSIDTINSTLEDIIKYNTDNYILKVQENEIKAEVEGIISFFKKPFNKELEDFQAELENLNKSHNSLDNYINIQEYIRQKGKKYIKFEIFSYALLKKLLVFLEYFEINDNNLIEKYIEDNLEIAERYYGMDISLGTYYYKIQKLDDNLFKKLNNTIKEK